MEKSLETIILELNNTDILPQDIPNILSMQNKEKQDALLLAIKLGYNEAVRKLLEPVAIEQGSSFFKPGLMERQIEVGGSGISTIRNNPRIIDRVFSQYLYFDIFKKDIYGKSAFSYALINEDKTALSYIYETRDYDLRGNDNSLLGYYIYEYSRSFQNNTNNIIPLRNIILGISKRRVDGYKISEIELLKFLNVQVVFGEVSLKEDSEILDNLIKSASQDVKDKSMNVCISNISENPSKVINSNPMNGLQYTLRFQKELLKNGANINLEQILKMKEQISKLNYLQNYSELLFEFNEMYLIDQNNPKTIIGKSRQVVEAYFKKDYREVLKEYIEKGMIDYNMLEVAAKGEYDIYRNSKLVGETRIGLLANLGANVSLENEVGDNIFSRLNTDQIIDIARTSNLQLTDKAVLEIAKKDYGYPPTTSILNVYELVLKNTPKEEPINYLESLTKSPVYNALKYLSDNNHIFGMECYRLSLPHSLNNLSNQLIEARELGTNQDAISSEKENVEPIQR